MLRGGPCCLLAALPDTVLSGPEHYFVWPQGHLGGWHYYPHFMDEKTNGEICEDQKIVPRV